MGLDIASCLILILDPVFIYSAMSQLESEVTDLKSRLEAQETETQRADSISISEQEKLKKEFEMEKKAWVDEKIALINQAEKAEAALEEATVELTDLKRHVSQMVSAIFGKSPCKC